MMYSDGMEPTRGQKIAGVLIGDIFGIFLWFGISYFAFKYWGDEHLSFAIAVAIGLPLLFLTNIAYDEKPGYEKNTALIFCALVVLLSGFFFPRWIANSNIASNTTVTQEVTPKPEKSSTKKQLQYSATDACEDISTIQYEYFKEFKEFRFRNDGKGWAPLGKLTDKATTGLDESIRKINGGIKWDSFAITSSMLSAASSYMTEIVDSVNKGFFSPGRDLEALLQEIEVNLTSVANSACN